MRMRPMLLALATFSVVLGLSGCERLRDPNRRRLFARGSSSDPFFDGRDDRTRPIYNVPPPGVPRGPGGSELLTPQPYPPAGAPIVPGPSSSSYGAPAQFLYPAPPASAEPPVAEKRKPEPAKAPDVKPAPKSLPADLLDPKPGTNSEKSDALPVGILFFADVKDKVSSGLKPDPEGLDWLRDNKYKTVLHLRKPGSENSADKEQVEKRGLTYLTMEVSAVTLTKQKFDEFARIVADAGNKPLFIYDKDGSLMSALCYLQFRLVDKVSADLAKTRAERLGYKETGDDDRAALAVAVKMLLDDAKP